MVRVGDEITFALISSAPTTGFKDMEQSVQQWSTKRGDCISKRDLHGAGRVAQLKGARESFNLQLHVPDGIFLSTIDFRLSTETC
jgi:hypothetical protein